MRRFYLMITSEHLAGEDWNGILIQNLAELAASALLYITKQSEKTGHQYFEKLMLILYNHHDFSQPLIRDKISFFPNDEQNRCY